MAPVLNKKYTKIVNERNQNDAAIKHQAVGLTPLERNLDHTFDIEANNGSTLKFGKGSQMNTSLVQNTNMSRVQQTSGRKEDSIRSWIKNPGPLTRDSFSKFHDTDNSMDNSAIKVPANESPDLVFNKDGTLAQVAGRLGHGKYDSRGQAFAAQVKGQSFTRGSKDPKKLQTGVGTPG